MIEEIEKKIKIEIMNDLLFSRVSEAVKVGDNYYCVECYLKSCRINVLRELRNELYSFNCVYCSSIKKYLQDENT